MSEYVRDTKDLLLISDRAATHPRILFLYHKMAPTSSIASKNSSTTGMITENAPVDTETALETASVAPPTVHQ